MKQEGYRLLGYVVETRNVNGMLRDWCTACVASNLKEAESYVMKSIANETRPMTVHITRDASHHLRVVTVYRPLENEHFKDRETISYLPPAKRIGREQIFETRIRFVKLRFE